MTVCSLGLPVRLAIDRVATAALGGVQLDAAAAGLRPRELDRSARRDLLASLRRRELHLSGIDLWIPPEHFVDPAHSDRAMDALQQAISMAADLGRVPICITLPRPEGDGPAPSSITGAVAAAAESLGVTIIDFAVPLAAVEGTIAPGIDPPSLLTHGIDPMQAMMAAERIGQVRVRDLDRFGAIIPLGHAGGRLSPIEFKAALDVVRPLTMPVIDTRGWRDPFEGVQATLAKWTG